MVFFVTLELFPDWGGGGGGVGGGEGKVSQICLSRS